MLQLHSQINKSFSRSTKLSKVTDELQKRIVQPWTLEAAICSMNFHTRSGINGQDGEAAFIIIHVGNLNSKSLTLQITVLPQNLAKDKGGHLQSCTNLWFWWSSWKPSSTVEVLEAYRACCRVWQNFMSVQDKMWTEHVSELFYFSSKQVYVL